MYDRILVPVDGSEASNRGLDEAIRLARHLGSRLKLIHVVNELFLMRSDGVYNDYPTLIEAARAAGRNVLQAAQARLAAAGMNEETEMIECVSARAADVILAHAREWGADLLVIGTHGRRGLRRLALGSDAETILRMSPIPVLLVRAAKSEEGAVAR